MNNTKEKGEPQEGCPYDPQQVSFEWIIEQLIEAHLASRNDYTWIDALYWKGVALARDARVHPSLQPGTVVKRKALASIKPFTDKNMSSEQGIDDDEVREVVRVIFMLNEGKGVWYLELEEEVDRIFPEDQFDIA